MAQLLGCGGSRAGGRAGIMEDAASARSAVAGRPAPPFKVLDQDARPVALNDWRGTWVVLSFYPKDDTPGCSCEATECNRRIILPNSTVFTSTVENITHHATRRVDVKVGVEYSADLDRTREVLTAAAAAVPGKLDDPPAQIILLALGNFSVDWQVRGWCKTDDYWTVLDAATRAVKVALDEAGLGIPFPQMDVHLDRVGAV